MRWLATIGLAVLLAGCFAAPSQKGPGTSMASATDCLAGLNGLDLNTATIADLQAALTAGRITSLQLVDAYLARIGAFDHTTKPELDSIRDLNPTARDQARALDAERSAGHVRGPLHGIPILLKDNIDTFDEPTTAGSIALAKNVPPQDATVTKRLRDAGMIILGKTNMSEFAGMMGSETGRTPLARSPVGSSPAGFSSLGGQVVNAYTGETPGGSSSGSGVAGSMAFSAVTLGTHTSGSILYPSWQNSLVGIRPTTGLTSRHGVIPLASSFDTVGPMARNVADAAAVLDAMAGSDPLDPRTAEANAHVPAGGYVQGLRMDALQGVRLGYYDEGNPDFPKVLKVLGDAGAVLVPFDPGQTFQTEGDEPYDYNEFKFGINQYLANDAGPDAPADLTAIIAYNQQHMDRIPYGQDQLIMADAMPGDASTAASMTQPSRTVHQALFDKAMADNDLQAIVAWHGFGVNDLIGYPGITVPWEYNGTTPYGIVFQGPAWSDANLLAYAYVFEQATKARIPPTMLDHSLVRGVCHEAEGVVTAPGSTHGSSMS